MITEIEVDGVGIMRHLNNFQLVRIRRIANRQNRDIACIAFGLGMTVRQFKGLAEAQQRAARDAHIRLHAPDAMSPRREGPAPVRLPRPYERVSAAKAAELGAGLLRMKHKLPHGHFQRWIEEKSGITYSQAQRFIRAAGAPRS